MVKKPEKSSQVPSASGRAQDYLHDPVPLPEVVESDSDTAWGLWNDTVQTLDDPDTQPSADSTFGATMPSDLVPNPTPFVKRRTGS